MLTRYLKLPMLTAVSLLIGCASGPPPVAFIRPPAPLAGTPFFSSFSQQLPEANLDSPTLFKSLIPRNQQDLSQVPAIPLSGKQVDTLPGINQPKQLTYMTYEALDNNLYGDLNRVLNTLEFVGSNPTLNLLAQTDNWKENNTARYYLTQDANYQAVASPFSPLNEENSGDPNTLAKAVQWGFSQYPAKTNWLNISSHGLGFASINSDDNPESSMNIIQFAQALKAGLTQKKLDIISFDACLMATVEVASELQPMANIMVGSEDSTFYWGYGYYQTFSRIVKQPLSPENIARSLVMDVNNKGTSQQTLTISATDLRKMGQLEVAIDQLARVLRRKLPQKSREIILALKAAEPFRMAEDIPFRDLNRVMSNLKTRVNDPEINNAIAQVNTMMYRKGLILFSRQSKLENDQGRGLSIYVPLSGKVSQTYRQTRFAQATQWDEFLLELNALIH